MYDETNEKIVYANRRFKCTETRSFGIMLPPKSEYMWSVYEYNPDYEVVFEKSTPARMLQNLTMMHKK